MSGARSTRWFGRTVLVLCLVATPAHADDDGTTNVDETLVRVRDHFAKGELAAARDLLVATYARVPRADLLFALGQVEFNLGHYAQAIEYYERFLATGPGADEAALAHQAIGTARARLNQPLRVDPAAPVSSRHLPSPPRRVRDWDAIDTGLVIAGTAAVGTGAAMFVVGFRRGNDPATGTLRAYDKRLDRSLLLQRAGVAAAAGGVLLVGFALVRWRVHRVEVAPAASTQTAGVVVGGRW